MAFEQNLLRQLQNLELNFTAASSLVAIKPWLGNRKEFKVWIKSVEKQGFLTNGNDDRLKHISLQTSGGAVSDFIHSLIRDRPQLNWGNLKWNLPRSLE